jgi:predicted phage-related endonuclease
MTFTMIPKPKHGSQQWLENRWRYNGRCVFGASDIPVLLGVSPWRTRGELYFDKITPPTVKEETAAMRRGNLLEAPLLAEAGRILGQEFVTPEFQYLKERLMVSFDGLPADYEKKTPEVIVEVKTTTAHAIESGDDLPDDWRAQGWAQSEIFDGAPVFFVVLDRRQNISVVELKDNPQAREYILEVTEEFGQSVENQDAVEQHVAELDAEQIASYFKATEKTVELDKEAMRLIVELDLARRNKADAEKMEKASKDGLAKILLDASIGTFNGETVVSWKETAGRESFDSKAFQKAHPDIYKQFTKITASYRTMRLTNNKGDK